MGPLTEGITPSDNPMGSGSFSMEHGPHSAPIGTLAFGEDVTPFEKASSSSWTDDKAIGAPGGSGAGAPNASFEDGASEMSEAMSSEGASATEGETEIEGGANITRLNNPTY